MFDNLFRFCIVAKKGRGNRAAKSASILGGTSAKRKIWKFSFVTSFGKYCIFCLAYADFFFAECACQTGDGLLIDWYLAPLRASLGLY